MQFIKLKDRFLNLDNINQVHVWREGHGLRLAEITFLAASSPEVRAATLPLRLMGEEAEVLIDWLERHSIADLSGAYSSG
jgi:hypothetical protein